MSDSPTESPPTGTVDVTSRRPRVKYQVFVSSTYVDLRPERERVVWAVLEARHIPVGMENFTATDERGWRTITRVIDDTDYYVLILAGLYGSVDPETGISWTQREYEYATSKGIPVLAFVREASATSGDKVETDPARRAKLHEFLDRVRGSHLYKTWKSSDDLSAAVASALRNAIQDDADDNQSRPGWIRGDSIPSISSFEELARLSAENARLRSELEGVRAGAAKQSNPKLIYRASDMPFDDTGTHKLKIRKYRNNYPEVIKKVLESRDRTIWYDLAIRNAGAVAARNLVIDFTFNGVGEVHFHLDLNQSSLTERVLIDQLRSTTNHCRLDAFSHNSVRQRVALVVPGGIEPLLRFGVELSVNPAIGLRHDFDMGFNVVAEDGGSDSGRLTCVAEWIQTIEMVDAPMRPS